MRIHKDYSPKRGDSLYPLHEGAVVELIETVKRRRPGLCKEDPFFDHKKFFWIQHLSRDRSRRYQERPVRVMVVLIPQRRGYEGMRLIYELREGDRVQLETLKKWMRKKGYKYLGKILFTRHKKEYGRFYEMIGVNRIPLKPVGKGKYQCTSPTPTPK